MAEITLTPAQQSVIDHRGSALLVSAAAGSGKTKVLVERVLDQVCNPDDPANINDFLIITFSEAAASEMRMKIMKELSKRQAADPENRHLQRQSARIGAAQISTVHAFCAQLLRKYCNLVELPADFRVCDQDEAERLLFETLEQVLTERYETIAEDADFAAFVAHFGYGRDDSRLREVLLTVYESVRNRTDALAWLSNCEQAVEAQGVADFSHTPWGKYLIASLSDTLALAVTMQKRAMALAEQDAHLKEKYLPAMQENLQKMQSAQKLTDWDCLCRLRESKCTPLGRAPKDVDEAYKTLVQEANKDAQSVYKKALSIFYAPSAQMLAETRACAPAVRGLCQTVRLLDRQFSKEKLRRKLLDFGDLEHKTISLICNRQTGKPTECAKQIAAGYREIMVDEYQDSNAVQELIFSTLSKNGQNRFMVGDVKQSIYRFRKADPSIFLQKYESYGEQPSPQGRKILLSENFRSRAEILNCVNDVFSLVMSKHMGEIDYTEKEALKNGRAFPPLSQQNVELHCISIDALEEPDGEPSPERVATEAEFVAERIARLLAEKTPVTEGDTLRPCRPEDIAILLRSPSSSARYYKEALARRGILCTSDRSGDILKTTEIETLVSMLQIIDNPMQDIPLLSAMASPVFTFTPEELALPRTKSREGCYYDSLLSLEEKPQKLRDFLHWLESMRESAQDLGICDLIDLVLQTTDLAAVFSAMENGAYRRDNLHTFHAFAASFQQRNGPSLGAFTRVVQQMLDEEKPIAPKTVAAASGAVQIVSIHHSKGLEYPIVILADLARSFNRESLAQPVLLDDEMFIGTNIVDPAAKAYYPGVCKQAIARKIKRQADSEEMRNLYVAMTRAQDMLIMTYCRGKLERHMQKLAKNLTVPLNPELAASVSCMGDWILLAALCRTESGQLLALCGQTPPAAVSKTPWLVRLHQACGVTGSAELHAGQEQPETDEPLPMALWDETPYAYADAVTIPSKLTATQLKGRNIDLEAAEQTIPQLPKSAYRKPSFLPKTALTAAEKGNATHLFMQFVRYESCTSQAGIEQEKKRLVAMEFLTPQQAEAVHTDAILRLFQSPFGARILQAENVRREFKFSLLVNAEQYAPKAGAEKLMLQGVVDCFWQEAQGLVIVDFKTDRIRGNLSEKIAGYTPQVQAYCKALSKIYALPVQAAFLYFFDANRAEQIAL